ncbi:HdeD family acid-resistance protein [Streptomyces sp. NPDC054770]
MITILGSPNVLLWRGILAVGFGVVSLLWPGITVGTFVYLYAFYAFFTAVNDAVRAFSSGRAGPVFGWLLLALLSAVGGAAALLWPGITALALTLWVGAWALVTGAVEIGMASQVGESAGERAMFMLTGLVSVALAFALFVRPDVGAVSLATVFGLFSLMYGISGIVLSFHLRQRAA